jgi:hypothetical protein
LQQTGHHKSVLGSLAKKVESMGMQPVVLVEYDTLSLQQSLPRTWQAPAHAMLHVVPQSNVKA